MDLADLNNYEEKEIDKNNGDLKSLQNQGGTETFKKPDYFSIFKERIEELKESLNTRRKESINNSSSIFSELGEHIKERIDKLLEVLDAKKEAREQYINPYKTKFEKTLKNLDLSV